METTVDAIIPRKAFVILIFQVIAWGLILMLFFEDFSANNDAAGAGMARGLGVLFVVAPCMVFLFFTTFYFFKKNLPTWFRFISTFNYIGLFIVFIEINW